MMPVKFRAWDINKNMWVTDFLIDPEKGNLLCSDYLDLNLNDELKLVQFTGKKDINGVDMYCEDIIRFEFNTFKDGLVTTLGIIKCESLTNGCIVKFIPVNKHGGTAFDYVINPEIIGNTYKNPEIFKTQSFMFHNH